MQYHCCLSYHYGSMELLDFITFWIRVHIMFITPYNLKFYNMKINMAYISTTVNVNIRSFLSVVRSYCINCCNKVWSHRFIIKFAISKHVLQIQTNKPTQVLFMHTCKHECVYVFLWVAVELIWECNCNDTHRTCLDFYFLSSCLFILVCCLPSEWVSFPRMLKLNSYSRKK